MNNSTFDVVVVGAGFAGMYLLHRLRGQGLNVRVLEAGADVGGTWYWNRYPGARCDIESMQYSYQFDPELQEEWHWNERYSPQPQILEYAQHVAERYDLRRDIQFNARVSSQQFDEGAGVWHLHLEDGSVVSGHLCVMATGCLSKPNWPDIEGLDTFAGATYHTALWPHDEVRFDGQRVAVIGTGSSAIQSIPHIAEQASQLYVFQRTPNFSIPAQNQPMDLAYESEFKSHYAERRAQAKATPPGIFGEFRADVMAADATPEEREAEYRKRWEAGGLLFMGAFADLMLDDDANRSAADFVRDRIRETVKDPTVAELLCPDNIIGGKRLCVDTSYYETFNRDNVSLVSVREQPIDRISNSAVLAHGEEYKIDALVIATGFDAMTGALTAIDIRGRGGVTLAERWAAGPSSYLGLAMADFPNLFTVTGPGSPSVFTNMMPTIEQHVEWICDCIAYMRKQGAQTIEARRHAEDTWWQHVQEVASIGLKSTTDSWYLGANVAGKARVFMPYYGGFPLYVKKCDEVAVQGYASFELA
jgi:cyclohexanone monooxygenase